uniref:Zinc finger PHD-type domain-containing protein n=1 Tax=Panagrolaimus sp. ES5 TaxID=591445 RepID=A0AC34FAR0_9BILA
MKESQAKTTLLLPVKESCHLNVIEEVIETVTSFSTFNKKRLEESQDKTLKLPVKESCHLNVIKELNSTSLIVEPGANGDKNESTDNVPVNANSEKWKTKSEKLLVMKDNFDNGLKENEKAKAETIFEESEEAQDFELLIETSFEPLIDDLTSISIVEEELIDKHESEDELVDPDDCPVKCICGFNHLEQQTIFCEKCRIWKHIKCLKAEKYANSEDEYCCPECQGKILPLSPSEAQDLVSKSMKLEHLDFKTKQCQELKLSGALQLEWKAISEDSAEYKSSKVGKLIHEGKMRWAVLKKGQAGRLLAGFRIKLGDPVIGVNGIASYMADAKNYCTCYRNLNLSFLPEPIIIEMKGRNAGLAHEILPSCHPNCEIKFCVYKNNLY